MEYSVWTFFVGSEEEAQEFANEWNEVTNSSSFRVGFRKGGASLIEGEISSEVLEETNIQNEFVVE